MTANFIALDSIDKLDELIDASYMRPVLIFKHSDTCGISFDVRERLQTVNGDVHVITVQEDRATSNAVVERFGVRHASPQAFVVCGGKPVYHATHYGIDPNTIDGKLNG